MRRASRSAAGALGILVLAYVLAAPPATGEPSALRVSPGRAAFGEVGVGGRATTEITVTNAGTESVTIAHVSTRGAPAFSVSRDGCSDRSLEHDSACSVVVAFAPRSAGDVTAVLDVQTDAGSATGELTGTGTGPRSATTPPRVGVPPAPATSTGTTSPPAPTTTPTGGDEPSDTTAPATTALPTDDASTTARQAKRDCEARAAQAVVTYQPDKEMVVAVAEPVEVVATAGTAAPPSSLAGGESPTSIPVHLACLVEAELSGPDFDVQPEGWVRESFLATDEIHWTWLVKPTHAGHDLPLRLEIRSLITDPDGGDPTPVGPSPAIVEIVVKAEPGAWYDGIGRLWGAVWSNPIWPAAGGVVALLTFLGVKRRTDPRGAPQPPTAGR